MKKQAWLILTLIALVAGLALAATNMVTAGPIEEQRIQAARAARIAVFPDAGSFEEMPANTDSGLDSIYEAKSASSDLMGYVLQVTVSGYAGPIEIIMGVDTHGAITGLSVGGSNFAETAGLGTQVKDPAFRNQFVGLTEMPTLNGNVDTISGATISSSAVINGVIRCYREYEKLAGDDDTAVVDQPEYTDGVYTGEAQGYGNLIQVSVTVDNGTVTAIEVLEADSGAQKFSQVADVIIPSVIAAGTIAGVDAVTDATVSSQNLLDAIADALNKATKE